MDLDDELTWRLKAFAEDRLSGALSLTADAIGILTHVLNRESLPAVARALRTAQPAMAPVLNAALAALAGSARFEAFERRLERAPAALIRVALQELRLIPVLDSGPGWLRIVTYSGSGSVLRVLESLALGGRRLHVSVGEGRPHLEGREVAGRLARAGIPVDCYVDAALGHAIDEASVILVGADAIGPDAFINKSGTRMVLAAAAHAQVPAYVVATRDKLTAPAAWPLLHLPDSPPAEVWAEPSPGVTIRNRYFEYIPSSLATAFLTDLGVLDPGMLPAACEGLQDAELLTALEFIAAV